MAGTARQCRTGSKFQKNIKNTKSATDFVLLNPYPETVFERNLPKSHQKATDKWLTTQLNFAVSTIVYHIQCAIVPKY